MDKLPITNDLITEEVKARIEDRVIEVTEHGCYLTNDKGKRDNIHIGGKTYMISRMVYKIYHNVDPGKFVVMHTCDHPNCINPLHLHLGTQGENLEDMHRKDRHGEQRGSSSVLSKLTDEDVTEIRRRFAFSKVRMTTLGNEYGVSEPTISNLLHFKSYVNVPCDNAIKIRLERKLRTKAKDIELNQEEITEIMEMRETGATVRKIAYTLELPTEAVLALFQKSR